MIQDCERISFLHWRYPPDAVRPLLPRGLELDTFEGAAWVGLAPFEVRGLHPPGFPPLPWISQFFQMNVRTYVRGPDGERGIWFLSLEADRLATVAGARLAYGLPYRWAEIRVRQNGAEIEYKSRRHFGEGSAEISIRTGPGIQAAEREIFLTARYRLYTVFLGRLAYAEVEHPPWPLQLGTAIRVQQDVIKHSGIAALNGEPLVHFSPGVKMRIGLPRMIGKPIAAA